MPRVLRVGPYRFFFFSNEDGEPSHIHAQAGNREAKFWLEPVQLAGNYGFAVHELHEIERLVKQHQLEFIEAWDEHFSRS